MIKDKLTPEQEYILHMLIGYTCLCLAGMIGLHRFYFGKWVSGILYILTLGFLGIGVIVDVVLIPGWVEEKMI